MEKDRVIVIARVLPAPEAISSCRSVRGLESPRYTVGLVRHREGAEADRGDLINGITNGRRQERMVKIVR